jgi:hypothetical protein
MDVEGAGVEAEEVPPAALGPSGAP